MKALYRRVFVLASIFAATLTAEGCASDAKTDTDTESEIETEEPQSTQQDLGTVVYLDVTDEDGNQEAEYYQGHPIRVTVRIEPAEGMSTDLMANDNMHVGLVAKLDEDQDASEGSTCYLGQVYDRRFGYSVRDDGTVEFISEQYIPEECLNEDEDRGVFNVWVALNPARSDDENDTEPVSPEDLNTQFFTDRFEDLDGDRNRLCKTRDGEEGCIIDMTVTQSPGFNIELRSAKLTSNVMVIGANECAEAVGEVDHELELQTEVVVHGADNFDGESTDHDYYNVLEKGETAEITWELCPVGSDGDCASDYLKLSNEEAGDAVDKTKFSTSYVYSELVPQRPYIATHNLNVRPDKSSNDGLCERLLGLIDATEDWSTYTMFNLRTCVSFPRKEAGHGDDAAEDNCIVKPVRMVLESATGNADASSLEFQKDWSKSSGNSVVGISGAFGTDNYLNLSGAYAQTYGKANITGWMSISIIDLYFEARAWVAVVGSGIDSHIDVFGTRYWEYSQNIDEVSMSDDYSYAKEFCVNYNYGIAGLGLNASLCASGEAGLNLSADVTAVDGDGPAPFDASTRIGQADGTVEPYATISLSATASLNVAVAKGGITGTLNLLDVHVPGSVQLNWGLIDGPQLVITYDVDVPLQVTLLSGDINVWAKLLKLKWCKKGWIKYPCSTWDTIVDELIVSFSGFSTDYTLLTMSGSDTLF